MFVAQKQLFFSTRTADEKLNNNTIINKNQL